MLDYPLALLWRMTLPAARALRGWFDENVPDGKDDYDYADRMLDMFVSEVKWGEVGNAAVSNYLAILEDAGCVMDDARLSEFLRLLTDFVNSQPIWPNNGWAPDELLRRYK